MCRIRMIALTKKIVRTCLGKKCLSHEPGQIDGNSTLHGAWSHLARSEVGLTLIVAFPT